MDSRTVVCDCDPPAWENFRQKLARTPCSEIRASGPLPAPSAIARRTKIEGRGYRDLSTFFGSSLFGQ
jgi:hypothetical protein